MTCKRAPKAHVHSVVSLFITTVVVLFALGTPTQLVGSGHPSLKQTVAPVPQSASAPASSTIVFLPAVPYGSGGDGAHSTAAADFNGDGKVDLAVANFDSNTVGVLLGSGDGTFKPAVTYNSGGDPTLVVEADVNGDGRPDLVVANYNSSTVGVLLGNGDGTFQTVATYASGGNLAWSVAVADVNGDNRLDLLVTNQCVNVSDCAHSSVGVLLGNGDGTFQAVVTYDSGGVSALSVAAADVNADDKSDLLVANLNTGTIGVLLGNGDGTFQAATSYNSGGAGPYSLVVADLNGDRKPDLVVANSDSNTVSVLLGNGDGTFQAAVSYASGGSSDRSVAVADVNGDGKPDLMVANACAVSNCASGVVGVLLGNGDGTFEAAVTYLSGGFAAQWVAVADVNADGRPDLLIANCGPNGATFCGSGVVAVLLNNTPDTTPPVITLFVTPRVLWPPNGKMVPVTVSGTITDTGSGVNVNSAAYTVKDEYGRVQLKGAVTLDFGGKYSFTVLLQASRLGTDLDGRRYTVTVRAKDNAGNGASKTAVVTVPHNQRH
jgi:FG-GAP-like repeat/FG-GAP repeat